MLVLPHSCQSILKVWCCSFFHFGRDYSPFILFLNITFNIPYFITFAIAPPNNLFLWFNVCVGAILFTVMQFNYTQTLLHNTINRLIITKSDIKLNICLTFSCTFIHQHNLETKSHCAVWTQTSKQFCW